MPVVRPLSQVVLALLVLATCALAQADAVTQQAYLKASNADIDDHFGWAVAVSGDTAVVGAPRESNLHGAAYVFVRVAGVWVQQAYLKASDVGYNDLFGTSVAISGDTIVVGAHLEDSNATGVNGDSANNSAFDSGAAYVFTRSGGIWTQQAYLKASNTAAFDHFGWAVGVSGDTVVVGAYQEDSNATGIDGNQADNSFTSAGAVYVFARSGGTWSQQAYLKASNTGSLDSFGASVAVSGNTVVVGASIENAGEDSNAVGVNGDQSNNGATNSGAAYVFVRSGSTWSQQAYLKASNTTSSAATYFGNSVSISGDTIAVGAPRERSNATGVNGSQFNASAPNSGAVYVFTRSGSTWSQQAYVKASNTGAGDWFGFSVAVSEDALVVGAKRERSNATGVDGNQADDSVSQAGAAYAFGRSGGTWSQLAYLKASNIDDMDQFGHSVGLSGSNVVSGAFSEDSAATGVNGDDTDDSAVNAGAAWAFDLDLTPSPWADLGLGLAGTYGVPSLVGTGPLLHNTPVTLTLSNALENTSCYLVMGSFRVDIFPFYGGTLVPAFTAPFGLFVVLPIGPSGTLPLAGTWDSAGIPPGFSIYFQMWVIDAGGPFGFSASNAVSGTTP